MTAATKITGPHFDGRTAQSKRWAVTLYEPGRGSEIHRFETEELAQIFADTQRREQEGDSS
jgi:hypothetical protein